MLLLSVSLSVHLSLDDSTMSTVASHPNDLPPVPTDIYMSLVSLARVLPPFQLATLRPWRWILAEPWDCHSILWLVKKQLKTTFWFSCNIFCFISNFGLFSCDWFAAVGSCHLHFDTNNGVFTVWPYFIITEFWWHSVAGVNCFIFHAITSILAKYVCLQYFPA